ncbi:MAG: preprotein translocase subunit SecG [bacterium P3]|nr:MAG: preprotein translocase subunit SecG [bacterium P3]KWW40492.1 MAG: preprotein translocase subunit SecG [bacterium F083]
MYTFLVVLILIVCLLLAVVVLVQNSKGGGLAANFSAPNQFMGVRRTADFLEKATWWLAIILVVLSLAATASIPHRHAEDTLETEVSLDNNISPVTTTPTAPAAVPQAE